MQCPHCHEQLEDETIFCGNCGRQVAPLQAQGATITAPDDTFITNRNASTPQVATPPQVIRQAPIRQDETPPASLPTAPRRSGTRRVMVIAALLVIVVAGGVVLTLALLQKNSAASNPAANAHGQITFLDGPNGTDKTDALNITINGLNAAPTGFQYDAWLVNVAAEQSIALGTLTAHNGAFSLVFSGNGSGGQPGTNLLSEGNQVEITMEQGNVNLPTGRVILLATFPPKAFVHIKHLLFSFPTTPGKIGLLVGLLVQTRLLSAQALALQSIAAQANPAAIRCVAQSIVDIAEGQLGPHSQALPASCGASIPTGDTFGILGTNGYASTAAAHASLAATQSDSTDVIRQHASEVEAGMTNIQNWVTSIDQDALALLSTPSSAKLVQQIVTLSDQTLHGVDANGNGQIEPIAGEEGATLAYLRGQLMATLQFTPQP